MTWIDAREPGFAKAYPYGAWVYDAKGRALQGVIACNSDTGEVLTADCTLVQVFWYSVLNRRWPPPKRRDMWLRRLFLPFGDSIGTRHGFWPAPLTLIIKQATPATQQLLATAETQEVTE